MEQPPIYFKQFELGPMANFIYFIGDPKTRELAVVDPAWDVNQIIQLAEQADYRITHALITHGHPDHINGVEDLLNRTNAKLYLHKDETPWLGGWKETAIATSNNDIKKVGSIEIEFLHTPGHTPGSQCFRIHNNLVSGDTLFIGSCGRTDLPGGDTKALYDTLTQRLMKLPDDTILYPGHNYAKEHSSTMGDQKKTNPVLQIDNVQHFIQMMGPSLGL